MSEPLYTLHCGDCLEVLRTLPDNSVDAVVTDPPAGIGFMTGNSGWDGNKGGRDQWINWLAEVMVEVKRVLKPGGHALVWSIARTQHWTATACENAGFEVRDVVSYLHDAGTDWSNFLESLSPEQLQGFEIALASQVDTGFDSVLSIFGSGFPKGLNISLKIDELLGKERTVVGEKKKIQSFGLESNNTLGGSPDKNGVMQITAPASDEAAQWEGWKTALKPAVENWILLRKPVEKGLTIAENVLKHGCGGLNVGASAIETTPEQNEKDIARVGYKDGATHKMKIDRTREYETIGKFNNESGTPLAYVENGRYPSHLILDSSDAVEAIFPDTGASNARPNGYGKYNPNEGQNINTFTVCDKTIQSSILTDNGGSASRYFYHAKVSLTDRNEGCENLPNRHATVKSNNLCRYLCRLITPPNGVILDCFMGSGSTGKAAMQEGFRFIGIEQNPEYVAIAEARILHAIQTVGVTPEKAEALNLSNPLGLTKDVPIKMF